MSVDERFLVWDLNYEVSGEKGGGGGDKSVKGARKNVVKSSSWGIVTKIEDNAKKNSSPFVSLKRLE